MRAVKIIFGVLLALIGFVQLAKVILLYIELPFNEWPIGAEFGTLGFIIGGIALFISGVKKQKATPKQT
ncbi:MAG: hypothetical protein V4677_14520 [Bacteroidota bacterium]